MESENNINGAKGCSVVLMERMDRKRYFIKIKKCQA